MDNQPAQEDPVTRVLHLAYLILCLAYMGWAMWHLMVPEHSKQMFRMRLLRSSAQVTSRLAHRTGVASLRHEALTGVEDYGLPYRLSLARLRLEGAYDRARGVIR